MSDLSHIPTPRSDAAKLKMAQWQQRSYEAGFRGSHLDSDDPMPDDGWTVARQLERELAVCRDALNELLHRTNDIEVIGEWEALDINPNLRRKLRPKIDSTIEKARFALESTK